MTQLGFRLGQYRPPSSGPLYLQMGSGTGGGAVLAFFDGPGPEELRSALSGPPARFEGVREGPALESEESEKDPPEGSLRTAFPGVGESRSAFAPASSNWARVPIRQGWESTSSWDDRCNFRLRALLGYLQTWTHMSRD